MQAITKGEIWSYVYMGPSYDVEITETSDETVTSRVVDSEENYKKFKAWADWEYSAISEESIKEMFEIGKTPCDCGHFEFFRGHEKKEA